MINAEHHLRVGVQYRFNGHIDVFDDLPTFQSEKSTGRGCLGKKDVFSRSAKYLVAVSSSDVVSLAICKDYRPS